MVPRYGLEPQPTVLETAMLPITPSRDIHKMVGVENFEISTYRLKARYSASELHTRYITKIGGSSRIRTCIKLVKSQI